MKFPWIILIGALCLRTSALVGSPTTITSNTSPILTQSHIKERLQRLDGIIDMRYDPEVKYYLQQYIYQAPHSTEEMLGRAALYFPIFEHYLQTKGLPMGLKYLPIIESRLLPRATSPVGARGLWQFTYPTGRAYSLAITQHADERRDPIRSTEAAVAYLADLHAEFDDWALVLAAYNCGAGRVRKAIRAANSRDFWTVRSYLPSETQKYIPRFIAANYIMNYFGEYNLVPAYPEANLQRTQTIKVYEYVSFAEIAERTGISKYTIAQLNPSYHRYYIPTSVRGYYLVLPEHAVEAYRNSKETIKVLPASVGRVSSQASQKYIVQNGETLTSIARKYDCTVSDLKRWNGLNSNHLHFRQALTVYTQQQQTATAKPATERWYENIWKG